MGYAGLLQRRPPGGRGAGSGQPQEPVHGERQAVVDLDVLGHIAHPQPLATVHRAAGRRDQAQHYPRQSAFASAIGADQGGDAPGGQGQADLGQHAVATQGD